MLAEREHELKKCCGEFPRYVSTRDYVRVKCLACGRQGPTADSPIEANIEWNKTDQKNPDPSVPDTALSGLCSQCRSVVVDGACPQCGTEVYK